MNTSGRSGSPLRCGSRRSRHPRPQVCALANLRPRSDDDALAVPGDTVSRPSWRLLRRDLAPGADVRVAVEVEEPDGVHVRPRIEDGGDDAPIFEPFMRARGRPQSDDFSYPRVFPELKASHNGGGRKRPGTIALSPLDGRSAGGSRQGKLAGRSALCRVSECTTLRSSDPPTYCTRCRSACLQDPSPR